MAGFWHGRRVLLTGDSGFKGAWLRLWLEALGARVTGLSLDPPTEPALFRLLWPQGRNEAPVDLRDAVAVQNRVLAARPDVVFHLGAQSLVRAGYADPAGTHATNVQGTVNLLEACRLVPDLGAIVVVTTDKVYANDDSGRPFREDDPLGGHDPYSASKAAAEIVVASYHRSFFAPRGIGLATARAGNVIGGGDWAADRIVPDAVRAFLAGKPLAVRRPQATRPFQHVLEPLHAYLVLAERLHADHSLSGAYNIGPDPDDVHSVAALLDLSIATLGHGTIDLSEAETGPHEARALALDNRKARDVLGILPRFAFADTVAMTWNWYAAEQSGGVATDLCLADIARFAARLVVDERRTA